MHALNEDDINRAGARRLADLAQRAADILADPEEALEATRLAVEAHLDAHADLCRSVTPHVAGIAPWL